MSHNEKEEVEHGERDVAEKSDSETALTWTDEEEKKIRNKMDWHIVPLVTVLYMLCFLDRINTGNARIAGLAADLDIASPSTGYKFNWALCIFYIVYLLVEVPSNIILKHVGPRFYLPALVVGFGVVTVITSFVHTWEGLMICRSFLGIFEGGAFPGIAFFLSSFYKRKELLFRIGIYVSSASLAGAFGGLLAYAFNAIPEWGAPNAHLLAWRNIYFFEGLITMICGSLAPIWMPTKPSEAWFLTERERAIANERLIQEHKADPDERVDVAHVKRAIFNIHNYTCAFGFFLVNITVQGLSVFLPTILKDLNYEAQQAQLMTVPPYVCACLAAVGVAYLSDKTHMRGIYLAGFSLLAIIGFAVLRWAEDKNARYMAVYFITVGAFPGGPGFLAWAMNNAAGPAVRAVTAGYVVSIGTIGGIVATWTYVQTDAPRYPIGNSINLGGQIGTFTLAVFGIWYCSYENKLRAAGKRDHRLEGLNELEQIDLGYRHPHFRYWV